jgi:hypothetical protein
MANVKLVKYVLRVLDKKIPENSFETNPNESKYPLLRELENTYGQEVVTNNFESLVDGDVVTFPIANKHNVSVQISED